MVETREIETVIGQYVCFAFAFRCKSHTLRSIIDGGWANQERLNNLNSWDCVKVTQKAHLAVQRVTSL
jgi:hypothetical protein